MASIIIILLFINLYLSSGCKPRHIEVFTKEDSIINEDSPLFAQRKEIQIQEVLKNKKCNEYKQNDDENETISYQTIVRDDIIYFSKNNHVLFGDMEYGDYNKNVCKFTTFGKSECNNECAAKKNISLNKNNQSILTKLQTPTTLQNQIMSPKPLLIQSKPYIPPKPPKSLIPSTLLKPKIPPKPSRYLLISTQVKPTKPLQYKIPSKPRQTSTKPTFPQEPLISPNVIKPKILPKPLHTLKTPLKPIIPPKPINLKNTTKDLSVKTEPLIQPKPEILPKPLILIKPATLSQSDYLKPTKSLKFQNEQEHGLKNEDKKFSTQNEHNIIHFQNKNTRTPIISRKLEASCIKTKESIANSNTIVEGLLYCDNPTLDYKIPEVSFKEAYNPCTNKENNITEQVYCTLKTHKKTQGGYKKHNETSSSNPSLNQPSNVPTQSVNPKVNKFLTIKKTDKRIRDVTKYNNLKPFESIHKPDIKIKEENDFLLDKQKRESVPVKNKSKTLWRSFKKFFTKILSKKKKSDHKKNKVDEAAGNNKQKASGPIYQLSDLKNELNVYNEHTEYAFKKESGTCNILDNDLYDNNYNKFSREEYENDKHPSICPNDQLEGKDKHLNDDSFKSFFCDEDQNTNNYHRSVALDGLNNYSRQNLGHILRNHNDLDVKCDERNPLNDYRYESFRLNTNLTTPEPPINLFLKQVQERRRESMKTQYQNSNLSCKASDINSEAVKNGNKKAEITCENDLEHDSNGSINSSSDDEMQRLRDRKKTLTRLMKA